MAVPALACLLLCAIATCVSANTAITPLLLWSNKGFVGQSGGSQALYKVVDDVEDIAARAVAQLAGKDVASSGLIRIDEDAQSSQRKAIIVFAGTQLAATDLRKGSAAKLNFVLESASSSLVLPYASGRGESMSLYYRLELAGLKVKAVGCGQPSEDIVNDVLNAVNSAENVDVVVVCPTRDAALSHTQAGLDQELDQLLSVQEAIDATEMPHLFVYMSQRSEVRQPSRMLQEASNSSSVPLVGFGNYTACGALCQTQVRWLEALLAVLFLALASCAGMTCLNVLNTPTRYEVLKEGQ